MFLNIHNIFVQQSNEEAAAQLLLPEEQNKVKLILNAGILNTSLTDNRLAIFEKKREDAGILLLNLHTPHLLPLPPRPVLAVLAARAPTLVRTRFLRELKEGMRLRIINTEKVKNQIIDTGLKKRLEMVPLEGWSNANIEA